MIKESLKTLNLSDKEIDIYLYLLNNGPSLAPNIINKTGLNRTNVYTLISSLSDKGLVIEKSEKKIPFWQISKFTRAVSITLTFVFISLSWVWFAFPNINSSLQVFGILFDLK